MLGRHVGNSAHGGAGRGEFGAGAEHGDHAGRGGTGSGNFGAFHFSEAEVENFDLAAVGDEKIGGFDVAVNDALGVSGFEGVGDLDGHGEELVHGKRLAIHDLTESLALKKFHDEEVLALVLLDGVDGADVGVIEGGGGAGFALEAFDKLRILGHFGGKKFYSDATAEAGVFGFVDDTHAAAAEFAGNFVVGKDLTNERAIIQHGDEMLFQV